MQAILTAIATFFKAATTFVEKNKAGLAALIAFLYSQKKAAEQINKQQEIEDAHLQADYAQNRADIDGPDDTLDRMQDGRF
jgi:hypothetical protein